MLCECSAFPSNRNCYRCKKKKNVKNEQRIKTADVTQWCLSFPHLQVPDQTRPPLSGPQSGQQQEVQRRAIGEPQVRYAGQHPSVRDGKKRQMYCQNTAREKTETLAGDAREMLRHRGM